MSLALVALGANLGDRRAALDSALGELRSMPRVRVVAASRWHRSQPIGGPAGQDEFLNGAVLLETSLSAQALLAQLHTLEARHGRLRDVRWRARTLDLDLLLFDDLVCDRPDLIVPHPRMALRRFVLEPAAEVAPDLLHPLIGWSVAKLLAHLNQATPYLALTSIAVVEVRDTARVVAERAGGVLLSDPAADALDAGRGAVLELESLERRAVVLRRAAWPATDRWVVSDFWLGQSLALAAVANRPDEVRRRWEAWLPEVVPPKLLVVLLDASAAAAPPDDARRRLQEALVAAAGADHSGPKCVLPADQPHLVDELTAALQAMR